MANRTTLTLALTLLLTGCPTAGDPPLGTGGSLTVAAEGEPIANGGTYCTPLNSCNPDNVVALFSEQRTSTTITNASDAPVTIDSVSLTRAAGNMVEEWTLIDTELVPSPLAVDGTVLQPGDIIDFYPRFFPVRSDERSATITITYDGGDTFAYTITGNGSYDSLFFGDGLPSQATVWGGADSDEQPGGMVLDASGGVIANSNVNQIIDAFTEDIAVTSIDASGALRWAKIWNGQYEDLSPDPGQNGESGGSADSIAIGDDGSIYVAGRTSQTNSNSTFYSLLLKIDAGDGSIVWERAWSPDGPVSVASDSSMFYAVHVDGDRVYCTGAALGESEVSLVVYDTDGALVSATAFEVHDGFNDRGYAIDVDAGTAYIGGNGNGDAILLRVDGADTAAPSLAWATQPGLGTGGNINSVAVDDSGDVYVAYDIRGAQSHFAFGKVGSDGQPVWTKEYAATAGDKNNVHVVRWIDGALYVGGRTGPALLDAQMGDALMIEVNPVDGTEVWAAEYFNGTGPDELSEHRVKGIGVVGDDVVTASQVYTGTANYERYWGYWYAASGALVDATITFSDRPSAAGTDLTAGALSQDAVGMRNGWEDAPATVPLVDATEAVGTAPDAGVMVMRIAP